MIARSRSHRRASTAPMMPPAVAPVASRRLRGLALAALVGFAAGALAWWANRPQAPPVPAAPDPAAGLSLERANGQAADLVAAGRAFESLPFFRRQFALIEPVPWALHKDYATALHNAAIQGDDDGPVTRSSLERVRLLCESLHQLDLADRVTRRSAEQAALFTDRAHTFEFWGMPWDALAALERAAALPATTPGTGERARRMRTMLEHPDRTAGAGPRGRG